MRKEILVRIRAELHEHLSFENVDEHALIRKVNCMEYGGKPPHSRKEKQKRDHVQRRGSTAHLDAQGSYLSGTGVVHEAGLTSTVSFRVLQFTSSARKTKHPCKTKGLGSGR